MMRFNTYLDMRKKILDKMSNLTDLRKMMNFEDMMNFLDKFVNKFLMGFFWL